MSTEISLPIERYLGIDLHKHYLVIGGVNAQQAIVLPPRRIDLDDWPKWAKTHLTKNDLVVVEATQSHCTLRACEFIMCPLSTATG